MDALQKMISSAEEQRMRVASNLLSAQAEHDRINQLSSLLAIHYSVIMSGLLMSALNPNLYVLDETALKEEY